MPRQKKPATSAGRPPKLATEIAFIEPSAPDEVSLALRARLPPGPVHAERTIPMPGWLDREAPMAGIAPTGQASLAPPFFDAQPLRRAPSGAGYVRASVWPFVSGSEIELALDPAQREQALALDQVSRRDKVSGDLHQVLIGSGPTGRDLCCL